MYNMMMIFKAAVRYMKVVKTVNHKSSLWKKNHFLNVSISDDGY